MVRSREHRGSLSGSPSIAFAVSHHGVSVHHARARDHRGWRPRPPTIFPAFSILLRRGLPGTPSRSPRLVIAISPCDLAFPPFAFASTHVGHRVPALRHRVLPPSPPTSRRSPPAPRPASPSPRRWVKAKARVRCRSEAATPDRTSTVRARRSPKESGVAPGAGPAAAWGGPAGTPRAAARRRSPPPRTTRGRG